MKFGKRLYAQRFKDWQQYYIPYDLLKKHIKFCMQNPDIDPEGKFPPLFIETSCIDKLSVKLLKIFQSSPSYPIIAGKLFRLFVEKELDKVNAFYRVMEKKLVHDFHTLERSLPKIDDPAYSHAQASKETLNSFVKYCKTLDAFRYYVVLNYLAVYKVPTKFPRCKN